MIRRSVPEWLIESSSPLLFAHRGCSLKAPENTISAFELAKDFGIPGIELMLTASEGLPLDCFFMAPSCVPASPFENAGATLDAEAIADLLIVEEIELGPANEVLAFHASFTQYCDGSPLPLTGVVKINAGLQSPVSGLAWSTVKSLY